MENKQIEKGVSGKSETQEPLRFIIKWNTTHLPYYTVSIPNYDGGEVVEASAYDAVVAENERLRRWVELFNNAPEGAQETVKSRFLASEMMKPITDAWKLRVEELEASIAWLVEAVIADHNIAVTPDKEAWLKRARNMGVAWRERKEEDRETIVTLREDNDRLTERAQRLEGEAERSQHRAQIAEDAIRLAAQHGDRMPEAELKIIQLREERDAWAQKDFQHRAAITRLERELEASIAWKETYAGGAEKLLGIIQLMNNRSSALPLRVAEAVNRLRIQRFVNDWLWKGENRVTSGMTWSPAYKEDVITMISDFVSSIIAAMEKTAGAADTVGLVPGTAGWHVAQMKKEVTPQPHPDGQCDKAIITKREGVYVCGQCGETAFEATPTEAQGGDNNANQS